MRALSLCTCCRHYPGAATGGTASLIHPVVSAFPERVAGSACASAFSRLAQRSLTLRPAHSRCHQFVTRLPEGFSHFVPSMTAPVASGWSGCRTGLTPAGKRRLFTAHTQTCPFRTAAFCTARSIDTSRLNRACMLALRADLRCYPPHPSQIRTSAAREALHGVIRARGSVSDMHQCGLQNIPGY